MTETLNISVIEDKSVAKKIQKTTKKLSKKFGSTRRVDEEKLKRASSPFNKILSGLVNTLLVVVILFSLLLSFCCLYGRIKRTIPTFAGFSFMQIVTGSMTAETFTFKGEAYSSGHKKGDKIVIRAVDAKTLKPGDKIAFYVYAKSFNEYYSSNVAKVSAFSEEVTYSTTVSKFFGVQPSLITEASRAGCKLVFHHIIEVWEDENGTRWFKTQGSSNNARDNWVIKEDYVIGIYDDSSLGRMVSSVLGFVTSTAGMVVTLVVPLVLLAGLMLVEFFKNAERAKLELDCIEEKRKITDEICVKNNVGLLMNKKTKYKILAQAKPEDYPLYISLLWKNGKAPNSIKKYALRKNLLLRPIKKKLELNRECETRYKVGLSPTYIAKYYLTELQKIKTYEHRLKRKLKAISKLGVKC